MLSASLPSPAELAKMAKSKDAGKTRKGGKVRPQRESARRRGREQRPAVDAHQRDAGGDGADKEQSALADVVARGNTEFSIAGVGASAGGFEGFSQVLYALPKDTGVVIILVNH